MIDYADIACRMSTAVLFGCVIGLDRNLHGKPTGMKTLALVALGASLTTMAGINFATVSASIDPSALSRTVQGIITGIGFLGAGVIVHDSSTERVRGLTTAASIWVTASIGVTCGLGGWRIAGIALLIVLAVLMLGRQLERILHRYWMGKSSDERARTTHPEE